MHLFVYEWTCAQRGEPSSLATEGWAMLSALLDDFRRVPEVTTSTLLHSTFPDPIPGVTVYRVADAQEERGFRSLARQSTASLIIAPEFDGLLEERCRWVEEEGGQLLGSSSRAVALTADKWLLAEHLRKHGLATPEVFDAGTKSLDFPIVLKPRFGAGSQATFLARSAVDLANAKTQAKREGWLGAMIVQPFVEGVAASAAFLIGPGREVALPPGQQHLSTDGRFHYQGGSIPLPFDLAERATSLARKAIRTVSGLHGYVGVDLVLGSNQDWVIEINPRLTTSYIGLRALTSHNLAETLLKTVKGEAVAITWKSMPIRFNANGKVYP